MMSEFTICITTINRPIFLEKLIDNGKRYGYNDFNIIVIGDYKSPYENKSYLKKLSKKTKIDIRYMDIKDQKLFLKKYSKLNKILPYNWGGRKMLANFISIKEKSPITIQIDDDNFILENNFFKFHSIVGEEVEIKVCSTKSKWVNVYNSLNVEKNLPIYPRGFSFEKRYLNENMLIQKKKVKVAVCNGLVLSDPDIDAFSRIFWPINVLSVKKKFLPQFAVKKNNWCPWNNQNTSSYYETTKIYFTPASVGRNSDIWTSLLICKISSHLNEVISFGQPIVKQIRNKHSNFKDYEDEKYCNYFSYKFENFLDKLNLTHKSHISCLNEVLEAGIKHFSKGRDFSDQFILKYFKEYRTWLGEVSSL